MANKKWTGNAKGVKQVSTITIANTWATGDTLTVTSNGKDLVLTAGAAVATTDIAAALKAMLAGDDAVGTETRSDTGDNVEEFQEFEATVSGSVVTLTATEAGVPFTVSVSESTAGSGTATLATPTTCTGPNFWDNTDNWDTGTIPVTGVNEVQTLTITGSPTGGTFTLTYSGQTTSAIAYNASAATVQAALEALSNIGAGNVSCSGGALPGTPVVVTFQNSLGFQNVAQMTTTDSLTGGSTPASAVTTTTAGSTGDDVYFENSEVDCLYNLSQSSIGLNSLNIAASYTGRIGLPDYNESGQYYEYRTKYLTLLAATTLKVGYGPGAGSPRIKLNLGSTLCTATVEKTAAPAEQGLEALLLVNNNAYSTLTVTEGSVGVAVEMAQTSQFATVRCGRETSEASDVTMRLGSGVTLTTVTQSGGDLEINSSVTTLNRIGGTCTLRGTGTVTTLNNDGGTLYDQSTGTKTTVNVASGSTLDRSRTQLSCTYTTTNLYRGATFLDPYETVTFTNPINLVRCGLADVELNLGVNFSLQRS